MCTFAQLTAAGSQVSLAPFYSIFPGYSMIGVLVPLGNFAGRMVPLHQRVCETWTSPLMPQPACASLRSMPPPAHALAAVPTSHCAGHSYLTYGPLLNRAVSQSQHLSTSSEFHSHSSVPSMLSPHCML